MDKNYKFPKVNFIGNKEKLCSWIVDNFPKDCNTIFDAFSGGCSVSYESKRRGLTVYSNDILKINSYLSKSIIQNSKIVLNNKDLEKITDGTPVEGFMYKNYSNKHFFPEECKELDLYRENIISNFKGYKKYLAFSLLRRSMIRKMPYSRFNIKWEKVKQLRDEEYSYLKYKRKRAYHNESISEHLYKNLENYNNSIFSNGRKNKSFNLDVFTAIKKIKADLIYLDPPYCGTMNDYYGFYNLLDEYIVSYKLKDFKNSFKKKEKILEDFKKLFSNLKNFKYWVISYNNRSYPSKDQMHDLLKSFSSKVSILEKDHNYQITGKLEKKMNKELLFIVEN